MKEATITLKLTKDQEVIKTGVTPVEAMLLVAEHHVAAGGNPVTIHKETVKDIVTGTEPGGKDGKAVNKSRSIDDELDRLRGKYQSAKIDKLSSQVREFPVDDFEKALVMGIKLQTTTKSFVSETSIK